MAAGIFVVDGHELVRCGIASILDAQPDLQVVGEASGCRDAVVRIAATRPDVVVLSADLPDGSGIELCRYLGQRHPGTGCLVLSADDDDDDDDDAMLAAILAGASGYLSASVRACDLARVVRAVASGRRLLRPSAARQAEGPRCADAEDPRFRTLNLRERQVLALIADGFTNRQIADRLGLAEKTVKNYVSTLLSKLGLEHRTQAAVFEVERLNERSRVGAGRW